MAADTPILIQEDAQKAFVQYYKVSQETVKEFRSSLRARLVKIDKIYQREMDETEEQRRAKAANEAGDPNRFQNVTVPVVMPSVETAVTYHSAVFLTGNPVFGVVSSPQFIDEALQMETIIENQAERGGWIRELVMFFRDGHKFNFAPIELEWNQEVTFAVETDIVNSPDEGVKKKVIWSGNTMKRLCPYNTFVDPRVAPTQVYKDGEWAGYTERVSRIKLKEKINTLPAKGKLIGNIKAAFESGLGVGTTNSVSADSHYYYEPIINPELHITDTIGSGFDWMRWASLNDTEPKIKYKDMYDLTTLYCRILPSDFGIIVPSPNTPQIYKLYIVNHEHVVYCERKTNAHNWIPIFIGQPLEDGLRYQTKSLAKNVEGFQYTGSALMNSIVHSRRRAVNDRALYDPSRVLAAHMNSENPSAKIPVKPSAFGEDIQKAVYQFPYREDQSSLSMLQIQQLISMSNNLIGQNQATQGQFVKGNKTLEEFDTVMENANGRNQTSAILLEHQVFVPMKYMIKLNILQYQGGTTLYNREKEVEVEINPVELRKSVLEFKVSDGLIPASKLINADSWATALQVIGSSSDIGKNYNIAPLFSYLMKVRGAKISEFEKSPEQVAFETAYESWLQVVQFAIEKEADLDKVLASQPKPEDYNYIPGENPKNNNTLNPRQQLGALKNE